MEIFTFRGRAGRLEYLGITVAATVAHVLNAVVFIDLESLRTDGTFDASPLYLVVFVAAMVASWSAAIRRCHDLGRSGFFLLWQFVPVLGLFAALYVLFARGDDMKNRFGPPPWSISDRAAKRAELEQAAKAAAMSGAVSGVAAAATAPEVRPEEAWVTEDGSFDMDGLWNESNIRR